MDNISIAFFVFFIIFFILLFTVSSDIPFFVIFGILLLLILISFMDLDKRVVVTKKKEKFKLNTI